MRRREPLSLRERATSFGSPRLRHSLSSLGNRQGEIDAAPRPELTLHPNPPAVSLDDSLRDRQTQSNSATISTVALPEATENVRQCIRSDAGSSIRFYL